MSDDAADWAGSTYHGEGWEAFGAPEKVTVRPLPGTVEWPGLEVTNGVFLIEVRAYGDSPVAPFVHTYAVSEERAEKAWRTVMATAVTEDWFGA